MLLQGCRVKVRNLTRADLHQMAAWRPFDDPLFAEANWPQRSIDDLNRWFTRCSQDPRRLLCAVTDETGRLIGSITLRERDGRRSARLGVTLGADFVNQGFGTEALRLFLDYYFNELGFAKVVLDVVAYNHRAIRVYQRLGFVAVSQRERAAGRGTNWAFLKEPAYAKARQFFRRDWLGRYWLLCYDMELRCEDWNTRQGSFGNRQIDRLAD
jgi:RimJ/RimL family protein N-acetyltransferase